MFLFNLPRQWHFSHNVKRTLHSSSCVFEKDETFYDVLGIDPTASSKEIKESYLELSKKYHPDVNPGNPDAAAKFHTVSQAYATLSQGKLRRMYDRGNLGRMSSVADRESATHSFDGSGFVEVRTFLLGSNNVVFLLPDEFFCSSLFKHLCKSLFP